MSYVRQEGIQRMEFPDEITYLRCRTEWLERYSHIYIFAYFVSIGAYSDSDNILVEISPTFEEIRARNVAMSETQRIQSQMEEAQRNAVPPTIDPRYHTDISAEAIAEYVASYQHGLLGSPAYPDEELEPSGGRTMAEVLSEEQVAYPAGRLITDENGNMIYVSGSDDYPIGIAASDGVHIGIPAVAAGEVGGVEEEKEVEIKKKSNIKKKSLFDVIDMD